MKNYYLFILLTGCGFLSNAQVGIGTSMPNASSQLDVTAVNKGILIPRVSLTSTQDKLTIKEGNVNSLLVFNTQTISDITPGYYYWYIDKWYRMGSNGAETITTLVNNNNGTITYTNEKGFPVTINLASGPQGIAGTNGKSAFEIWKEIAGNETKTIEQYYTSVKGDKGDDGKSAFEIWKEITGNETKTIEQYYASVKGDKGDNGKSAFEIWKEIAGNETKTIEQYYASLKGDTGLTGTAGTNGKSAFEIWKEIAGNESKTIEQYYTSVKGDKGDNGKSAFEIWKEIAGNETKTIEQYYTSLKGDTGLTGTAGIGGKSTAGSGINITGAGTDANAYIISTNPTDADKQNLTDLHLDVATNVLSATIERGNTKTVDLSTLKAEPWKIQATTDNATLNDQNIYQRGKVAIGTTSATAVSTKQLDVFGDFRTKYTDGIFNSGFESNFTGAGTPINISYIANNADVMAATEKSTTALYQGAATMSSTNGSAGGNFTAFSTKAGGTFAMMASDAANEVSSQIWGYSDPSLQSRLILSHVKSSGESSKILIEKLKGITFDFTKIGGTSDGSFTFPRNSGAKNQVLTTDGNSAAQLIWKDIAVSSITNTITGHKIADYTNSETPAIITPINETVTSLTDVVTQNTDAFGNSTNVHTLTFKDENGDLHPIDLALLVKGKETLTSLKYYPTTNMLSYLDENGGRTEFNLVDLVGSAQSLTSLTVNAAGKTLDYVDEYKIGHQLNLTSLVSEPWYSTSTNTGAVTNSDNIYTQGWVGIGHTSPSAIPNEKLRVNGAISAVNGYYADYVFEDYFKGSSILKKDYKFKSLNEVDSFIKTNKHLPGITPVNELTKTKVGYAFNVSELSVQLLEKTEELYLHAIEHQKQLETKDREINDLKKRLEKLEAIILKNN